MSDRVRVILYGDPTDDNSLGELEAFLATSVAIDFKYGSMTFYRSSTQEPLVYRIGQAHDSGKVITDIAINPW